MKNSVLAAGNRNRGAFDLFTLMHKTAVEGKIQIILSGSEQASTQKRAGLQYHL
ncbi:hypothetical protein M5Y49_14060 [Escherichia coli]|uniref:Uncharacterized protein n=1 Tax=Phytobacter palmae TaxID=1855371 RepID=A0ABU9V2X8_9ENTR|nr:hypothetical protein [Escherichia coli]